MEVIDDFRAEADEVHEFNPWFTYGVPIHRLREGGIHNQVWDLLDQEALSSDLVREFTADLLGDFGVNEDDTFDHFVKLLTKRDDETAKIWNPRPNKMEPWINIKVHKERYMNDQGPGPPPQVGSEDDAPTETLSKRELNEKHSSRGGQKTKQARNSPARSRHTWRGRERSVRVFQPPE